MTVESLNHLMTYVIETWALLSGAYLGVGFTLSFMGRVKAGLKAKAEAAAQVETGLTEDVSNAERVAEVTAVAEKYTKSTDKTRVKSSVGLPGK